MRTPREIELKFDFDPADERRLKQYLGRLSRKKRPTGETMVSVYFDTPDFRLSARGISLRVRHSGNKYRQTIKKANGQTAGIFDRAEWERDIKGPEPELSTAESAILDDLLNNELVGALRPIFETRVRRTTYHLASRGQRVELALDQGEIDTGKRRMPISELEFELTDGEPSSLFALARALNEVVPLRLAVKAKADHGYELLRNNVDPVDKAADAHLTPEMTTQDAFRIIANSSLRQLIANEPATIAGNVEALHQMRIALRRLRAAISAFANVVADSDWQNIKSELRWITRELGPARDLDVFVAEVLTPLRVQNAKEPGVLELSRDFERRRAKAHKEVVATITSARFRTLVIETAAWIEAGPWTRVDDDLQRLRSRQNVLAHASDELARRRRKVRRRGKTLQELSPLERHALRIAAKKLRYAVEFFAELFPVRAKRCARMLSALKDMQDALGGLNDIAVRERLAEQIALSNRMNSDAPGTRHRAFAAGLIFGSQEAHVAELLDAAEDAYSRLLDVKSFWK
jgi:inorganic triphosphatase YgiF